MTAITSERKREIATRFGASEKAYAGAGAGLETALPKGLLVAVEWGYGFQARDRDGNKGAHVFRATAYKIF